MESQLKLYDKIIESRGKLQEELPEVMAAFLAFRSEVYKDGALSHKMKRLIALAVSLRIGCAGCIAGQTRYAVEAGATKAEVLEAVFVAMIMGGTPAMAESWRVVRTLEEMGKW